MRRSAVFALAAICVPAGLARRPPPPELPRIAWTTTIALGGPSHSATDGLKISFPSDADKRCSAQEERQGSCSAAFDKGFADHTGRMQLWAASLHLAGWLRREAKLVWGKRVVELGCGVGVGSLAAYQAGAANVLATDGSNATVALARLNQLSNQAHWREGTLEAGVLRWANAADIARAGDAADLVMASDVLYFPSGVDLAATRVRPILLTFAGLTAARPEARLVIAVQDRADDNVQGVVDEECRKAGLELSVEALTDELCHEQLRVRASFDEGGGGKYVDDSALPLPCDPEHADLVEQGYNLPDGLVILVVRKPPQWREGRDGGGELK